MSALILNCRITSVSYLLAEKQIINWSRETRGRYVCVANVHMLMEAHDSRGFKGVVNSADLVVPDGMPLVWLMRLKGHRNQERVYGPTLMLKVLEAAAQEGIPVGFYGGTQDVLTKLTQNMQARFQGLEIGYAFSPAFTDDLEEQQLALENIEKSKVRILFVGLGCPKQERWMAKWRERLNVVMLGVGAAFDFYAGVKPQAPNWLQNLGFEWLFRLLTEPRRLWRRYFYHNPRFIYLALIELFLHR